MAVLCQSGVESVIDFGCGPGFLLSRLVEAAQFSKITGVDICPAALKDAERRLKQDSQTLPRHVLLISGSFTQKDERFSGYGAAVLLETIEHVEPDRLSMIENTIFGAARPGLVIITTPNQEYNHLLGVPAHRFRHPGHRFEWPRRKFESWCGGVAGRNGYTAVFESVGGTHPTWGGPTQMALFHRASGPVAPMSLTPWA